MNSKVPSLHLFDSSFLQSTLADDFFPALGMFQSAERQYTESATLRVFTKKHEHRTAPDMTKVIEAVGTEKWFCFHDGHPFRAEKYASDFWFKYITHNQRERRGEGLRQERKFMRNR